MLGKIGKYYPLQLETIPLLILFFAIYLTITNYANLPDSIPTHFDSQGFPDDWGSKNEVIAYPAIGFFVYILFTGISIMLAVTSDPKKLINLPSRIKDALSDTQAEELRTELVRYLLALKIVVVGMMTYLLFGNIEVALNHASSLGYWPFIFIVTILILVGLILYRSFRIAFRAK